jgi:hypothetical protein
MPICGPEGGCQTGQENDPCDEDDDCADGLHCEDDGVCG